MSSAPVSQIVGELRQLIVRAAPDPSEARAVESCDAERPLDEIIPFSSVIVLGTVVAIEHRYGIAVTNRDLRQIGQDGFTLTKLAVLIRDRCAVADEEVKGPCSS